MVCSRSIRRFLQDPFACDDGWSYWLQDVDAWLSHCAAAATFVFAQGNHDFAEIVGVERVERYNGHLLAALHADTQRCFVRST
jgi:uncharacterized protein CbrC (UPF0167 family)